MKGRSELANLAASIRQRLLNLARAQGRELQHVLSDYAIERLLYRVGQSQHAGTLVLKGATLLRVWAPGDHRATWDLDLLARTVAAEAVPEIMREVLARPCPDGLELDTHDIEVSEVRRQGQNLGARFRTIATLAGARIPLRIDVGLGDTVTPPPQLATLPVLLDLPAPEVLTYSKETVVAEKFEAMLSRGVTNTRMKDFYDLFVLASNFDFDGNVLRSAIAATLHGRETPLPDAQPVALTTAFLAAPERKAQWRSFRSRSRLTLAPESVAATADLLRAFLLPVLDALRDQAPFDRQWPKGGPWASAGSAKG